MDTLRQNYKLRGSCMVLSRYPPSNILVTRTGILRLFTETAAFSIIIFPLEHGGCNAAPVADSDDCIPTCIWNVYEF